MTDPRALYLDLMKRSLTYLTYGQETYELVHRPTRLLKRTIYDLFQRRGIHLMCSRRVDFEARTDGRDWPAVALTMIGLKRLDNLQFCVEDVLARNVPGDLIEAGVWRGGASIFLRAILKAHGVTDRIVCVADSFEGLPAPNPEKYPADAGDRLHSIEYLAVPLEEVKLNFSRYALLDDQVRFVKGWFRDTLPGFKNHKWSVIRMDSDMYESTMDALTNLYPNLSIGGYIIIDDYGNPGLPGCHKAVDDYREASGIKEEIRSIDWTGAFWQRRC